MLRTALLGMGGFGAHLARQVNDTSGVTLAAVVDVNTENLEQATTEFDVPSENCYTDEEAMYEETDLDAVFIATPPAFHYEQIRRGFDHDLHVLCEKPVVMDLAAARDVLEWTEESDRVFMSGYQRHLDPAFVTARQRWQDDDREPTFVTGELTQDWTHHFEAGTNWRLDPKIGGRGHLFSVGTHVVESVLWMTGLTPESVSAEMTFYDDDQQIDQQASLSVRFEKGATATLADTATVPATREHIHLWDDDGAVYLDGEGWGRRSLTVLDETGEADTPEVTVEPQTKVEAFVEAVEAGEEPPSTARDVLRVTALLDAAYESAREGRRVAVDL